MLIIIVTPFQERASAFPKTALVFSKKALVFSETALVFSEKALVFSEKACVFPGEPSGAAPYPTLRPCAHIAILHIAFTFSEAERKKIVKISYI